jgi:threonine dehydrogenase-like Zn-dependent dehydrogenase
MKAIVLDTPGQFRHVDLEAPPTPGPGEALVRVDFLEEGKIDLAPWITHRASSESMMDVFLGLLATDRGIITAVVAFSG